MKSSHDRKNYIDFQLDVLGGAWGYFENAQWTFCVKESICVWPQSLYNDELCFFPTDVKKPEA